MARYTSCGFRIRGKNHEEGRHHTSQNREMRGRVNSATSKHREPWANAPKGWKPPVFMNDE